MPWREVCPMDERGRFIAEYLHSDFSMTELCRLYEISRKTGHKWWRRFEEGGRPNLADRGRAPHAHPNATPDEVVTLLVSARKAHPTWGPRKLVAWLEVKYPRLRLPSASTVGAILKRHGMSRPQRRRPRATPYADLYLAETLAGEQIGIQQIDDSRWRIYFADVPLGCLDERSFNRERGDHAPRLPHPENSPERL